MTRTDRLDRSTGPGAAGARLGRAWLALVLAWLLGVPAALRAEPVELSAFALLRNDEGLQLSFAARFDLPRGVEEALLKGVPLHFVARADVFRDRWYWRDKRVASAQRSWRLAYQPLTRKYRVTFGALNQNHDNLSEALASLRRAADWKIAEAAQLEEGGRHYVEFSYRLDTSQLPRPMQIGVGGQADWALDVERVQRFQ